MDVYDYLPNSFPRNSRGQQIRRKVDNTSSNTNTMDIYNYVAGSNPLGSQSIINSFGYKVVNKNDMGGNLKSLVAKEGEPALKMVMDNHPDKEVILEMYSLSAKDDSCGCEKCKESKVIEKFLNANGTEQSEAKKSDTNFSLVFLAGILALSFAIISKK